MSITNRGVAESGTTIRKGELREGERMKRIRTGDKITEIKIRVSPAYKVKVQRQAKQAGMSLSYYIREVLEKKEEGAAAVRST